MLERMLIAIVVMSAILLWRLAMRPRLKIEEFSFLRVPFSVASYSIYADAMRTRMMQRYGVPPAMIYGNDPSPSRIKIEDIASGLVNSGDSIKSISGLPVRTFNLDDEQVKRIQQGVLKSYEGPENKS